MHILELQLATHTPLTDLATFYSGLLGELPAEQPTNQLCLRIGCSRLVFRASPGAATARYHFAINIPENQFDEAKGWLTQFVSLIQDASGRDTFYFEDWDASSLYFYDPAGNIVELIARHSLANVSTAPFTGRSLLSLSEIGVAAWDAVVAARDVQARTGAGSYRWSGSPEFVPVGDEQGLLLVVQQGRVWIPNTGVEAKRVPVTVTVRNEGETVTLSFA